jgi:hypothetical protein
MLVDSLQGNLHGFGDIDARTLGNRGGFARPATEPYGTGELMGEKIEFRVEPLDLTQIVEPASFFQGFLEFLSAPLVGQARLRIEQVTGVI